LARHEEPSTTVCRLGKTPALSPTLNGPMSLFLVTPLIAGFAM